MDKLKAISTFVTIAETGSLTAAADKLQTSLPSVVRQLADLENLLNVRLFNRTTRKIALTDQGKSYLGHCQKLLAGLLDAEYELHQAQTEPEGKILITAPVLFGEQIICPSIMRFIQRYPKVKIDIQLLDRLVNIIDEGFDLGIRIGAMEDSSLVAQEMAKIRRVIVASPEYLERHGTPRLPEDVKSHKCLVFTNSHNQQWHFHFNQKTFSQTVEGNFMSNQLSCLIEACKQGMGLGSFIIYQVLPLIKSGQLQIVLDEFETPAKALHLLYPESRLLPARTRLLIEWIKKDIDQIKHEWIA